MSKQAIVSDEREELERDLNFTEPTYEDVLNVSGKNLNISTRKSRAYNLGYWGYFVSKKGGNCVVTKQLLSWESWKSSSLLNSIVAETFSVEGDVVGLQEETQTAEPDVTLLSTWLEIYQFQLCLHPI